VKSGRELDGFFFSQGAVQMFKPAYRLFIGLNTYAMQTSLKILLEPGAPEIVF